MKKNYIDPDSVKISFPQKKKNLIIIFVESLEATFQSKAQGGAFENNLISEITKLATESINFSQNKLIGGGYDLNGTSFTIGGIIGKLNGIPYNIPYEANTNYLTKVLPNNTGLTDILQKNGYNQLFICGSDKNFASRGAFFETHGEVKPHDLNYYKSMGKIPEDYFVFWGFEDSKLYEFAKEELNILSKQSKPFHFSMLTVDTHFPNGYICDLCKDINPESDEEKIKTVLQCASKQLNNFINWCKKQKWYKNTTIVILGDHNFMLTGDMPLFPDEYNLDNRTWLNIFINSSIKDKTKTKNRLFSSFDIFPTVLESIGCKIEGRKLGLGVSLFSGQKTLLEKYGKEYVNNENSKKTTQYNNFIYE